MFSVIEKSNSLLNNFLDTEDIFNFPLYIKNYKSLTEDNKVSLNLPGIGKENITVEVIDERKVKIEWNKNTSKGSREFIFSEPIKDIKATYLDGILTIETIPEEHKIKKIKIE
jgi:HSP20 family molecular chaperone IbpA